MMRPSRSVPSLLRRQALARPTLLPRSSIITPRPLALSVRYASRLTTYGPGGSPGAPQYPSDSDYSHSTMYAFGYLSRIVRYVLYGVLTLGGVSLATFEGLHLYVENVCLASPSREALSESEDEYGWISENVGWTGGAKGGTDPRLGIKARHALRGAWICQEWGAGGSATGTLGSSKGGGTGMHPDFVAARGMIGSDAAGGGGGGGIRRVDRGYELADEFIDLAIREARKKGLVFPPTLSSARPAGPPAILQDALASIPQGDPAVLDLLLLKAGILERINTTDSLLHAKDIYETVLSAVDHSAAQHSPAHSARVIRLSGKVGDLAARTGNGGEAHKWWSWGLAKAGVEHNEGIVAEIKHEVQEVKGWFGRSRNVSTPGHENTSSSSPQIVEPTVTLAPPILRAAISLLISSSAQLAKNNSLSSAEAQQSLALSYLPSTQPIPTPTSSNADVILHRTWLQQRASLLHLHRASVLYAQGRNTAMEEATLAHDGSERSVTALQPLPQGYTTRGSPLSYPARILRRDALLTGAESSYTRAVFLERSIGMTKSNLSSVEVLEQAVEGFERAMNLSAMQSGISADIKMEDGESLGRSDEWAKYYRGFVRVRGKLAAALGDADKKV